MGVLTDEWEVIPDETPIDLSFLKDRLIKTRSALIKAEAENIRAATVKYLAGKPNKRTAPFSYSWVLKVHKTMYCDVWQWAGQVRQHDVNMGCQHCLIGQELGGLVLDIAAWTDNWPIIEQAATIHHRAVAIHPFPNGNGRWSRMLANIWLKRNGLAPIEWPEETIGQVSIIREEYIAAIKAADRGDYTSLIALHEKYQSS